MSLASFWFLPSIQPYRRYVGTISDPKAMRLGSDFGEVHDFSTVSAAQRTVDPQVDVRCDGLSRTIAKGHVDQVPVLRIGSGHDSSWREHARSTVGDVDVVVLGCRVVTTDPWCTDVREALFAQVIDIDGQAIAESFIGCIAVGSRLKRIGFWC